MNATLVREQLSALPGWDGIEPLSGGRTNYVWRRAQHVHKLYRADAATPLFGNDQDAEWNALTALKGTDLAPEPVAREVTALGPVLIYRHLDGPSGYDDIADVARLLGALHEQPHEDELVPAQTGRAVIDAGLSMLGRGGETLKAMMPDAPAEIVRSVILHRDPVVTNLVRTPEGLRLIDWQCPGIGDPVEDIAHFLSPAMMQLYAGAPLNAAARDRFLESYPDQGVVARYHVCGRAYHWRMACYCQWQLDRGNRDYAAPLASEVAGLEAA